MNTARRNGFKALMLGLGAAGLSKVALAGKADPLAPGGAETVDALAAKLASLEPRRDFKTVPMILDNRDQWDAEALDAVLRYAGSPKQSWDNTDLTGPWLNLMRNSMNAEIWSFRHPDFLCVSATHGTAQLALYDDAMWEKYGLAKLAGANVKGNRFRAATDASAQDPANFQNPKGPFSPAANSIAGLQGRGAVFLACHNAVWELSERLVAGNANPDHLSTDALCAELTNHLIPGSVLTPGAVGTLVELAQAGFAYSR